WPLLARWYSGPDSALRVCAAAGAIRQRLVVIAVIAVGRGAEGVAAGLGRRWIDGGWRGGEGRAVTIAVGGAMLLVVALALAALAGNALWSVAERWRYPAMLPTEWTLMQWRHHAGELGGLLVASAGACACAAV